MQRSHLVATGYRPIEYTLSALKQHLEWAGGSDYLMMNVGSNGIGQVCKVRRLSLTEYGVIVEGSGVLAGPTVEVLRQPTI